MRQNEIYTRGSQKYQKPRLILAGEHGTHSLKVKPSNSTPQCTEVLLSTTSIYSSTSAILVASLSLALGRSSPCLIASPQGREDITTMSAATHTNSFRIDSGFATLAFSSLLQIHKEDFKGTKENVSLTNFSTKNDELTLR